MSLTSEEILLNDPTLGRCYLCQWLVKLWTMVEMRLNGQGHTVEICEECFEKEGRG